MMTTSGCCRTVIALLAAGSLALWAQPQEERPASQFDIAGDFSYLLRSADLDSRKSAEYCVPGKPQKLFDGQLRFGNVKRDAHVVALCADRAVLEAELESPTAPTSVLIRSRANGEFVSLPYVPGLQYQRRRIQFFAGNEDADRCPGSEAYLSDRDITLYPEGDVKQVRFLACTNGRLTLEISAPSSYTPKTAFLSEKGRVYIFQSTPGSIINPSQPNVGFAVVDDRSVASNFGKSIADQYVVIDLQVRNPSTRKIQLRKSALWFEVDYRGSGPAQKTQYLFGKDHQFQHAPHDFLTVMGTFDGATSNKEKALKLSDIAITALAGATIFLTEGATLYPRTISWVAGIVNPTMRNILFNEQDEKRRRNQMLTQSFADIIQISPQSSVITKVFLPKSPIRSLFKDQVEVAQVRDVHLYLEVVSEMVEEVIAKGQLRLGLTMDQVSQALGYPDSVSKNNDQTVWRYNTGKFDSLMFNSEGKLFQWTERKLKDQIAQMLGAAKAEELQKLMGLAYAPARVELKDGSFAWLKPGNVDFDLVFTKAGVLDRINDKRAVEFLASLEGNIRMPEVEKVTGSKSKEDRPDYLGGRIWLGVQEKINFLFDRDRVLVNARYQTRDAVLTDEKKSEDANYTRTAFEAELAGYAASLFGDGKAAFEEYKKDLQKAKEACTAEVCTYPAPESPELQYTVKFSSKETTARFVGIARQARTAAPAAAEPKAAAPKTPAAKPGN